MTYKKQAFTLVELIVVITILAVLGTIGFLSYQGYAMGARDTVRISDILSIEKQIEFNITKGSVTPVPDTKYDILNNGTVIGYQGYAGVNVLSFLKIAGDITDPIDGDYYTYAVSKDLKEYQIIAFMEDSSQYVLGNTSHVSAAKKDRIIISKGSDLGIFLDPISLEPIQSTGTGILDIATTTQSYLVQTESNVSFIGTGSTISKKLSYRTNKKGSCLALLKNKNVYDDGVYTIDPLGNGSQIKVYCDMTTDGGGWTLMGTAIGEGTTILNYSDIVSWTPKNSDNCGVNTECLSQAGLYLDAWDELMVYTRGYRVKGTTCNDKNLSVKGYSQLPHLGTGQISSWFNLDRGAHGKCDSKHEVLEGKTVSDLSTHGDPWPIEMGIQVTGNSPSERSLFFLGPIFMPQGFGTMNGTPTGKIDNHYSSDQQFQANPWDGASTQKQVWFIR